MFKKIDFADASGKTIRAVVRTNSDDALIVSFDDATFSVIEARALYGDEAEVETDGYFDALDHRLDLVLEPAFGDAAKPMHAAALSRQKAADEESRRERQRLRRQRYEELKAEFE